jgi:hypothetical protein
MNYQIRVADAPVPDSVGVVELAAAQRSYCFVAEVSEGRHFLRPVEERDQFGEFICRQFDDVFRLSLHGRSIARRGL